MPKIWGLHNYSDSTASRAGGHATDQGPRRQIWLTETGGIVQFGPPSRTDGSGLSRAAKVLKYMFPVAGSNSQIKRLYIYDWSGGTASTRFDAGLTNAHDQPRAGYVVVCRQLHGAKCSVTTADN